MAMAMAMEMARSRSLLSLPNYGAHGDDGAAALGRPGAMPQHRSAGDVPADPPPYLVDMLVVRGDVVPPQATEHPRSSTLKIDVAPPTYEPPTTAIRDNKGGVEELAAGGEIVLDDFLVVPRDPLPPLDDPPDDTDCEGSISFSGVSSSEWVIRRSMRQFPPSQPWPELLPAFSGNPLAAPNPIDVLPPPGLRQDHRRADSTNMPETKQGDSASIRMMWSDLYDQRQRVSQCRRSMSELRSKITAARREKTEADSVLHKLTLSYSRSAKALPRTRFARLVENIQGLQNNYISMESRYEALGEELDRREAKLEFSEVEFFQTMRGAYIPGANSYGSTAEEQRRREANKREGRYQDKLMTHALTAHKAGVPFSSGEGHNRLSALSDTFLLGISGERPSDIHPLYDLLLKTIGDLNMAREGRMELFSERDDIILDLRNRISRERGLKGVNYDFEALQASLDDDYRSDRFQTAFASYLDEGDIDFLKRFDDLAEAAMAEMNAKENQVARIRAECVRMAILPKNMSFQEKLAVFGADDEAPSGSGMEMAVSHFPTPRSWDARFLAHWKFPILLSNPQHVVAEHPLTAKNALKKTLDLPKDDPSRQALVEDCVKEYGILTMLTRASPGNKSDFINRWILQQLRMSPLEAVHLHTIFSDILRVVNQARWQEDVLYFWARDGSNIPDEYFHGPVTQPSTSEIDELINTPNESARNKAGSRAAPADDDMNLLG